MKKYTLKILVFLFLYLVATNVSAGWAGCKWYDGDDCVDYQIGDIFANISKANGILDNNLPVMKRYRAQRTFWQQFGNTNHSLLTEGIADVLVKIQPVHLDFVSFVGSSFGASNDRCAFGSDCHRFQTDLIMLLSDLSELKNDLPVLKNVGFQDSGPIATAVLKTPYLALYSLYKTLDLAPGWQQLPVDLKDLINEIDDPDIFNLELNSGSHSSQLKLTDSNRLSSVSAFRDSTKTQKFCARRADKFDGVGRGLNGNRDGWDQIRINRWKLYFEFYGEYWEFVINLIPDDIDIGASILGEGGTLGIPRVLFTFVFEHVPLIIKTVMRILDVHEKNIDVCKSRFAEVEGRLATCRYFTEFVLDASARDEYYQLVQRRFDMADEAEISHAQSDFLIRKSEKKLESNDFAQAYTSLCDAYKSIGVAR
jgi:hypothetical protein